MARRINRSQLTAAVEALGLDKGELLEVSIRRDEVVVVRFQTNRTGARVYDPEADDLALVAHRYKVREDTDG